MIKFIFASNSPRRKEILSKFNIDIKFVSHRFNESIIDKNIEPHSYCKIISNEKANSIVDIYPNQSILSADTIVLSPNKRIFEKPKSKEDAYRMLRALSGKKHEVITGVSIIHKQAKINFSFTETTLVEFNDLRDEEIYYYIKHYEPFDKSGSYGIQGFSSIFVKSINGCYFNVVGLPVSRLFYFLKKFNLVQFS
tara:strand:+ start:219 stop:803 length:585 start_codon:yes stop_codon:yes gene_type:complete